MSSTAMFLPNILDYARVCLLLLAALPRFAGKVSICFYAASDIMDLLDGALARGLKQQSIFGNCLDMIVDRIASTLLLLHISSLRPVLQPIAAALISLDILSHWLRHVCGYIAKVHHKALKSDSKLLNFYYTNKPFLAFECLAYEATLIGLLASAMGVWVRISGLLVRALAGPALLKAVISTIQLLESARFMCNIKQPE